MIKFYDNIKMGIPDPLDSNLVRLCQATIQANACQGTSKGFSYLSNFMSW